VSDTGPGTRIAPTAFVGPGVELGVGVSIGPFAVIVGPTQIGDRVRIGPGAHVGGAPEIAGVRQNDAWAGDLDHHEVVIGPDTHLRDHVVVHHGSVRPTRIGARCLLFSRSYVAHDVELGTAVTLSAGVSIGGHATVGDRANLGLNVSVHQRRWVGALSMVGMGTPVTRDVPPFVTVYGVPARIHGVNRVGLSRAGVGPDVVAALEAYYTHTYPQAAPAGLGAAVATDLTAGVAVDVAAELAGWGQVADLRPMARASAPAGLVTTGPRG